MTPATPSPKASAGLARQLPGLLLAIGVVTTAFGVWALDLLGLSKINPLMLAILIGIGLRNTLGRPEFTQAGIAMCLRRPLRAGIILLGLQVTLAETLEIGIPGLLILAFALLGTFLLTQRLGARLGVRPGLATLIATGTGICGASAIVAANTVVRDDEEIVAYALATVTFFGTLAMFAYPMIGNLLGLDARSYGLWTGASVHEVAQVIAAGFARGEAAGEFATVAKLARVLMLAPLVIGMGLWAQRQLARREGTDTAAQGRAPMPWFVFGFLGMVLLSGSGWVPTEAKQIAAPTAQALLALALAAVGLETDIRKLVAQGWQPLALGALATAFIASSTLGLTLLWRG
ncbi:MAG: putative sulfate exporter family transporter [Gammaproteobacteria bacterium]|nr:putative sulfate exporter family transporter [Gammaproteobacteria bacterium]